MDCFDVCSIDMVVEQDKIMDIKGDIEDPITRGFMCKKGLQLIDRLRHPHRLTAPMKKVKNKWIEISWSTAIEEIGQQLLKIKDSSGTESIIHYSESGHGGLVKNIDTAFFNAYGTITVPQGSLCWGAGIGAQTMDFGDVLGHDPLDYLHAKVIIIWGRNPAYTNAHMIPILKEAQSNGAKIVLIDPVKTATAAIADYYYQTNPESDGMLAMAMAKIILEEKKHHKDFVQSFCNNFEAYAASLEAMDLEELIARTGLSKENIYQLTKLYADNSPSTIILGYGLQRYKSGGKNIRLIDALGALTGNIGVSGGGVNYANKYISSFVDREYVSNNQGRAHRTFKRPLFHQYVLEEQKDEVKGIVVTKSNLVLQQPNTKKTMEAFKSIPFKVVIDLFMTDTAQLADYVLPCTHIYEEEDFMFSSMWHNYFTYTEKAINPPKNVKNEFEIFNLLADYIGLKDFTNNYNNSQQYLDKALKPLLNKLNCSLEDLKGKRQKLEGNDIPWANKVFATPSKKFEFIVPNLHDFNLVDQEDETYPLQFLTLHPKNSLHSQHFMDVDAGELPEIFANENTLRNWRVEESQRVVLVSAFGKLHVTVKIDNGVKDNVVIAYEGWWLKNQGVNNLTPSGISDIGDQAIYNNCRCRLEV